MATDTHPVDELADMEFRQPAAWAARCLADMRHAAVLLTPGDATVYKIIVADMRGGYWNEDTGPAYFRATRYLVANSFGPIYAWSGERVDWGYVESHFLDRAHEWTARVLARWLNTLAEEIAKLEGPPS